MGADGEMPCRETERVANDDGARTEGDPPAQWGSHGIPDGAGPARSEGPEGSSGGGATLLRELLCHEKQGGRAGTAVTQGHVDVSSVARSDRRGSHDTGHVKLDRTAVQQEREQGENGDEGAEAGEVAQAQENPCGDQGQAGAEEGLTT